MTELNQVYKCEICGNIVGILHTGVGTLVCCNKPMVLMTENTVDASYEKHIPVITKDGDTVTVTVGSVIHPMEEKHYIEWIEVLVGDNAYRQDLKPGDKPEAKFCVGDAKEIKARAYCNLHGLWVAQG